MKTNVIKFIKIFIIALLLEVVLFNVTSYRGLFGNYSKKEFTKQNIKYIETVNGKAKYLIENIKTPIATIKLELENMENEHEYMFSYSDATSSQYLNIPSKFYVPGQERTCYVPVYFSGIVNSLVLTIDDEINVNDSLKGIIINENIPIKFNAIRFLILIFILYVVGFLKNSELTNSEYNHKNLKQEFILISILGIFLILLTYINVNSIESNTDNMYNKGLVDAFTHGSLSLLDKPSEEFLKMNNPYDNMERTAEGMIREKDFLWDSAYYNGNFYVYFGVLPVLLMFLPYFLITGTYLKCSIACYIFSILIFILLKEILCKLYKKYFANIPFKIVMYSLVTLYSGSIVLYLNGCARFYEVAIISALYFVLQGIYFILKSMEKEKRKNLNIFIGCLCMALAVACRPTSLLASILIVPYLLKEFIILVKNVKQDKKSLIKYISVVAIPYMLVAIPLMWYNYARFGSIMEFGAQYQLTINDMRNLGSRIFTIPAGVICNLFSVPIFIPDFPFITNHNKIATFYGYYYIENMIGGLFAIAPICFVCFYARKINKKIESKELKCIINSLIIVGLVSCIMSVAMAGSNERYLVDYAWMIVLAGILIFNAIFSLLKSEETKNVFKKAFAIVTIYTMLVSISSGIVSEKSYFRYFSPKEFYKAKYNICFWE